MNKCERKVLDDLFRETEQRYPASAFLSPDFLSSFDKEKLPDFVSLFLNACEKEAKVYRKNLSIVLSILSSPRWNPKGIVELEKSERVSHIEEDLLEETGKDASLWKKKGGYAFYPKEVYCRKEEEDLSTYENFFLTSLLDLYQKELEEKSYLLSRLLKTGEEDSSSSLAAERVSRDYLLLEQLRKKVERIQATPFYRIVKRKRPQIPFYEPTNILLHDPLYQQLYRDYRKRVSLVSQKETESIIASLCLPLFLFALLKAGYKIDNQDTFSYSWLMVFTKKEECSLVLQKKENRYEVQVTSLLLPKGENQENYSLLFQEEKKEKRETLPPRTFVLTPFSLAYSNRKVFYPDSFSLMEELCRLLYFTRVAEKEIYTHLCPNCLSSSILPYQGHYRCSHCHLEYSFLPAKGDLLPKIWFRSLGERRDK